MLEFTITIGIILFTWLMVKNLPDTNKPRESEREIHERFQKEKDIKEHESKKPEQETEEDDESDSEEGEMIYAIKKGQQ